MLKKRIIPCLDVKDGKVVKGVNFVNLVDAGSAIDLAQKYYEDGADELVFLDITATEEKRKTLIELVKNVAKQIRIPFTVGGGISRIDDIEVLLKAGADKISMNSSIVKNPQLITEAAKRFGSQAVVAAIDSKMVNGEYKVFIKGGKQATELNTIEWCQKVVDLGAGEILLTSMDKDGTKSGFDNDLLKIVTGVVHVPVIASGGAGKMEDFYKTFIETKVTACLAASLFHFNEISIVELKKYLFQKGVEIRL